ncbi:porin [Cupriavidus nantongensis]|uniref:porin n=1 Tax=Cupriavidus nantongensis TaxID=1796606 RepID=UPI00358FC731
MKDFARRKGRQLVLATAGALVSGNSHAQSGVTLYGVADMNVEFVNHLGAVPTAANGFDPGPAKHAYRMNSGGVSGSRWGLRGAEAIGGGMKAMFVLESGFNLDTGTTQQNRFFGRQAYVGLQSQYGQLSLGRQYTALFEAMANFVPASYSTQYEPVVAMAGPNFREDNAVKYSAAFGPVAMLAHWSFGTGVALPPTVGAPIILGGNGEVPGSFRRDTAYGAGLVYNGGGFSSAIAYDQFNPTIAPAAAPGNAGNGTIRKVAVAASYTVGPAKIMAGYRWGQNKNQNGAVFFRDDFYWIGGNYQVTPSIALTLEYNYDNVRNQFGNANAANPWQISLLANYALSKRTDLYLTTAYARHAGVGMESAGFFFASSLSLGNSYALANGQSAMVGAAVGLRHKF